MTIPADEVFGAATRGDADAEIWSFEAVTANGTGILVRWTVFGDTRSTWFWALLAQTDGSVVVVRDEAVSAPRGRTLEVRADGLWADATCEVPHEHWSLGLEAFAVVLDEAAQGWAGERGERLPFGFELDWERTSESVSLTDGYGQSGRLWGQIVLGRTAHELDGGGLRLHRIVATSATSTNAPAAVELRLGGSLAPRVLHLAEHATDAAGLPVTLSGAPAPFRVTARAAIMAGGRRRALAAGFAATADGERPGWLEVCS